MHPLHPDSVYFNVTTVQINASYEECEVLPAENRPELRPAYNVQVIVLQEIPASLDSTIITIDADVSVTF